MKIKKKKKNDSDTPVKNVPAYWCIGWSGSIELGFKNGTYLPRKAALILYPEYFDSEGNPDMEKLPLDGFDSDDF